MFVFIVKYKLILHLKYCLTDNQRVKLLSCDFRTKEKRINIESLGAFKQGKKLLEKEKTVLVREKK